jgi:hypothetical protein
MEMKMNKMMKTITIGLLLSGTVFTFLKTPSQAAPESAKFKELEAKLNARKVKIVPDPTNMIDFLDKSNAELQKLQRKLTSVLNKQGYLVGTPYADAAQTYLSDSRKNINSLKAVQNLPLEISVARAQVPLLTELLENFPVPDTFPGKCYNYDGKKVEGRVDHYMGRLVFRYGAGDKDFYEFQKPNEDVGLIGSGKENFPKVGDKNEIALLGPDNKTVVCLP